MAIPGICGETYHVLSSILQLVSLAVSVPVGCHNTATRVKNVVKLTWVLISAVQLLSRKITCCVIMRTNKITYNTGQVSDIPSVRI
jgi:hypothetical protein